MKCVKYSYEYYKNITIQNTMVNMSLEDERQILKQSTNVKYCTMQCINSKRENQADLIWHFQKIDFPLCYLKTPKTKSYKALFRFLRDL